MLRIFTPVKIQRLRPGLNPQTWVPEASMLNTIPPKPSILHYFSLSILLFLFPVTLFSNSLLFLKSVRLFLSCLNDTESDGLSSDSQKQ